MTSSYGNNRELVNNLFDDANPGDYFQVGGRVWVFDGEKWLLEHTVVRGDETIKQGPQGETGPSAYQSYLNTTEDFPPKSEAEWVESLKGADGLNGKDGDNGSDGNDATGEGQQGPPGEDGKDGDAICDDVVAAPTDGPRGKLFIDNFNQITVTLG